MSANVGISVLIHICTWSGPKSETLFMVDGLCGYRCLHAWCCLCLNSTYVLANEYLFEAHQSPMEKLTQMFGSFIAHKYQQHSKSPIEILPKKLNLYVLLTSVGSNPKISNIELLRTLEVELRTQPNPWQKFSAELQTLEVELRTLWYQ